LKATYPFSNITLIKGGGGVFDVTCDGKLIYSMQKTKGHRFPEEGEITGLIEQATG